MPVVAAPVASGCSTPPAAITMTRSSKPICSHVLFEWTSANSCCPVTQYQIRVKTKAGGWRELSAIPKSFFAFRVRQRELKGHPFYLADGDDVQHQVRSYNQFGWSNWSVNDVKTLTKI